MDMQEPQYDVCIIGGSIAGNYLAYLLSNSNLTILVIEEHTEIGLPFQCAGIISKKLTQLIKVPREIILNRVKIAKLVGPSGRSIELSGDEEPYIIDRIALDRFFYEKTKDNPNITYNLGEKFKRFEYFKEKSSNLVQIETTKGNYTSKILVGCDGPLSSVGDQVGVRNNNIFGTQIRIEGNWDENTAFMYFDPRWKESFGWIVPEGDKTYRIGMGASRRISENFKTYMEILKVDEKKKISQQGGLIPIGKMNKCAFDNILLVGDSAGQVKATTGGGVVMLLNAAKIAALCIVQCVQLDDFSKKVIKKYYEKPCKRIIGKQLTINYLIRLVLQNLDKTDFDDFFNIIKDTKIGEIISLYGDMDFPLSLVLKLARNSSFLKFILRFFKKNPPLLVQLVKSLIF
jgi:digeranylgeranylglycerophospholipid reductase